MVVTSKITSKGQITLPKEIRRLLNVHVGSVVVFEKDNEKIVIKPAKTLKEFRGYLKRKGKTQDFDKIRKITKKQVGKRIAIGGKD